MDIATLYRNQGVSAPIKTADNDIFRSALFPNSNLETFDESAQTPLRTHAPYVRSEVDICELSKRHSLTCLRCKKKEFFLSIIELVAYIVTGLMIILTMK